MEIRPLREADDRTTFHSGEPDLDRFIVKYAGQNQFRHHIGTTYVAVEDDLILGYVTVASGHVEADDLPVDLLRKLPHVGGVRMRWCGRGRKARRREVLHAVRLLPSGSRRGTEGISPPARPDVPAARSHRTRSSAALGELCDDNSRVERHRHAGYPRLTPPADTRCTATDTEVRLHQSSEIDRHR